MKKFERFSYESEVRRDVYDHEVFLGFHNDEDAYSFRDWLDDQGLELFQEYLDKNK